MEQQFIFTKNQKVFLILLMAIGLIALAWGFTYDQLNHNLHDTTFALFHSGEQSHFMHRIMFC